MECKPFFLTKTTYLYIVTQGIQTILIHNKFKILSPLFSTYNIEIFLDMKLWN